MYLFTYFRELVPITVGTDRSEICRAGSKLEIPIGVLQAAVLRKNFFFSGKSWFLVLRILTNYNIKLICLLRIISSN